MEYKTNIYCSAVDCGHWMALTENVIYDHTIDNNLLSGKFFIGVF